jgi:hypothetical protein
MAVVESGAGDHRLGRACACFASTRTGELVRGIATVAAAVVAAAATSIGRSAPVCSTIRAHTRANPHTHARGRANARTHEHIRTHTHTPAHRPRSPCRGR